ncbi:MAG: hypothetical protein GY926_22780, partial [bacterium]|nr:hypothetical protein [bacterium]
TTKTYTGLRVRVHLVRRGYEMGVKITPAEMQELVITKDDALPGVILARPLTSSRSGHPLSRVV